MLLIAITGACGSGKTEFSYKLAQDLANKNISCSVLNGDHYYKDFSYLTPEQRMQYNFCQPKSIDFDLLVFHLKQLEEKKAINRPCYDIQKSTRLAKSQFILPAEVIILEGLLIMNNAYIEQRSNIKIGLNLNLDICLSRRLLRDNQFRKQSYEFILNAYENRIRPSFFKYTEPAFINSSFVFNTDEDKDSAHDALSKIIAVELQTKSLDCINKETFQAKL